MNGEKGGAKATGRPVRGTDALDRLAITNYNKDNDLLQIPPLGHFLGWNAAPREEGVLCCS